MGLQATFGRGEAKSGDRGREGGFTRNLGRGMNFEKRERGPKEEIGFQKMETFDNHGRGFYRRRTRKGMLGEKVLTEKEGEKKGSRGYYFLEDRFSTTHSGGEDRGGSVN